MLEIWTEDNERVTTTLGPRPRLRQIIFINSAAVFLGSPSSITYTRKLFIIITHLQDTTR